MVKVNEARAKQGLPALTLPDGELDPDGELTLIEFEIKKTAALNQAPTYPAPLSEPEEEPEEAEETEGEPEEEGSEEESFADGVEGCGDRGPFLLEDRDEGQDQTADHTPEDPAGHVMVESKLAPGEPGGKDDQEQQDGGLVDRAGQSH